MTPVLSSAEELRPRSRPCPLCGGVLDAPFLRRPNVPIHQNVLIESSEEARRTPRGDLALAHCGDCDFVTNVAFDPTLVIYGDHYENSQVFSPTFDAYVDDLVEGLVHYDLAGKRVIEVGCGNGYFLRKLVTRTGCLGVGFDPSYRGSEEEDGGRLRFVREYYGPAHRDEPADMVVCRHVIEHVPDPVALLGAVRGALEHSPAAVVVFETPAIEWILDSVAYQDFFYEHCSYFSERSLPTAFAMAGLVPVKLRRVFGGQYLWCEALIDDSASPLVASGALKPRLDAYGQAEARRISRTTSAVRSRADAGGVAVWGAGAKGVTFLNLADPEGHSVSCVIDVNPNKQGKFIPGTAHPIVALGAMRDGRAASAIVMNPNYLDESRAMVAREGIDLELVTDEHDAPFTNRLR